MPALNESGLKEKLRSNPLGIYLIYGEESYLKKTYIEKIISKTVDKSFEDFNLHVFDGKECTLSDVYEIAGAVPMMAESKCVSVKDFPLDTLVLFGKRVSKKRTQNRQGIESSHIHPVRQD